MKTVLVRIWRAFAARSLFEKLNNLLLDMAFHGLGILNYENDRLTGERFFVTRTLPGLLRNVEAPVLVDVGAHVGAYSDLLLQSLPLGRLIIIEPHPTTFAKLERRFRGNTILVNSAMGSAPGELLLYDRADQAGSSHASLYVDAITELHGQEAVSIRVAVNTLDLLVSELSIDGDIDFLKIDTEGHELEVLKGCADLLAARRIRVVQIEFNAMNVLSRSFFRDFRMLLPDHSPYRLLPRGMISIREDPLHSELFGFQNVVFVPLFGGTDSKVGGTARSRGEDNVRSDTRKS